MFIFVLKYLHYYIFIIIFTYLNILYGLSFTLSFSFYVFDFLERNQTKLMGNMLIIWRYFFFATLWQKCFAYWFIGWKHIIRELKRTFSFFVSWRRKISIATNQLFRKKAINLLMAKKLSHSRLLMKTAYEKNCIRNGANLSHLANLYIQLCIHIDSST